MILPSSPRPSMRTFDPVKSAMEQFEWILRQVKWKFSLNEGNEKLSPDERLAALLNMSRMTVIRARNDMNDILAGRQAPLPATPLVMYLAMLCRPPLNHPQFPDFIVWYEELETLYQLAYKLQPKQYGTITEQRAVTRAERQRNTTGELSPLGLEQQQRMLANR